MRRVVLLCLLVVLLPIIAQGQSRMETFTMEYTYRTSEDDSRNSARNKADAQLRQLLLKRIGSFVESNYKSTTSIDNFSVKLNYDEAVSISTQGRVSMKIIDEKFDGMDYWMKAEMTVDVGAINAYLERKQAEVEAAERRRRQEIEEAERIKRAEVEAADRARRQKESAIANLQMQIDAAQKQVSDLEKREAQARSNKNSTTAEANKSKGDLANAEKEQKEALAFLNANPTSQTARRTVNIASEGLDEAHTRYNHLESQAKIANDLWVIADNDLKKERAHLESLRGQLRKLDSGEISAEAINNGKIISAQSNTATQQAKQPAQTTATAQVSRANNALNEVEAMMSGTTTRTAQTKSNTQAANQKQETTSAPKVNDKIKESGHFVFSVRPELFAGSEITSAGVNFELGKISKNGFYFTTDFSGGGVYFGGGLNMGICFNKDGGVKNVLGLTTGFWNAVSYVDFEKKDGSTIFSREGSNNSIAGGLWKLMFGKNKNFDITNKFLFGIKEYPILNKNENGQYWATYGRGLNTTYSIGLGYTLTKKGN